jgi:uncharacterized protein YcfL
MKHICFLLFAIFILIGCATQRKQSLDKMFIEHCIMTEQNNSKSNNRTEFIENLKKEIFR